MNSRDACEQVVTDLRLRLRRRTEPDVSPLLDPHRRVVRFVSGARRWVAKLCPPSGAEAEQALASKASTHLKDLALEDLGSVSGLVVVVPRVVRWVHGAALVSPDLGTPLNLSPRGQRRLTRDCILVLLQRTLDRGVEAPGLIPRNLFLKGETLHAIDWEDVTFVGGHSVDPLTTMKWDVAWSDYLRADPKFRGDFPASVVLSELDGFERTLAGFIAAEDERAVRRWGIDITLESELHVAMEPPIPTASDIGHLADEVLSQPASVFFTALTAHVRRKGGSDAYRRMLERLWHDLRGRVEHHAGVGLPADLTSTWLVGLTTYADSALRPGHAPTLADCRRQLDGLHGTPGWEAGVARAGALETLLDRLVRLVFEAYDLSGLTLLMRGSLAGGVVGLRSDVDFEISGRSATAGHRPAERLIIELLAAFGFAGEASEDRPPETDLVGEEGLTRDLHEWMELRPPGSATHDPGWLEDFFVVNGRRLALTPSKFESNGEPVSGRRVWAEARALLARLSFLRDEGRPSGSISDQLSNLRVFVDAPEADRVTRLVRQSFLLREKEEGRTAATSDVAAQLYRLRERLGLPGRSATE